MKKNIFKKIIGASFFLLIMSVGNCANASETNVHLSITVGNNYIYNKDISVSPCDSDNDGSVDIATAYCALVQAGVNLEGSWSSYGYFINSIKGISGYADSNGDWHYWEFNTNGSYASVGVASYSLVSGDTISLNFLNPSEDDIKKSATRSGGILYRDEFSVKNAINFLSLNQKEDGSFGDSLYTDWVAIGVAKEAKYSDELKSKLKKYLESENFEAKSITDYDRHAMALMSLGINPYTGTKINYIEKIVKSFDGEQIGDKNIFNDDIFSLIVLQNAGYEKDDEIISKIISYIISRQGVDGSWGSVDMTSASIMALYDFKDVSGVEDSIKRAYKSIKKAEIIKKESFGNSFSASWAMQAFLLEDWYEDEVERTLKFLAHKQDNEEGFMKEEGKESRIWATAYAIPAVSHLTWNDILDNFSILQTEDNSKIVE